MENDTTEGGDGPCGVAARNEFLDETRRRLWLYFNEYL